MTIRNIDDELKARLRVQAARHGRSMEDEVRHILRISLNAGADTGATLAENIRLRFTGLGSDELALPARDPMREPPEFGA